MISKKRALIYILISILLTSTLMFNFRISMGQLAVVPIKEFKEFSKYRKMLALKELVQKEFYSNVDEKKLISGSIKGMFQGLDDPYSEYMDEKEFKDFMEDVDGFIGIGIYMGPSEEGLIQVVSPIEGTPAYKAGIKSGDIILKINDKSFTAKQMSKAILNMRGERGEEVKVEIYRKSIKKNLIFTMKKDEINPITVRSQMLENKIGYIRIATFEKKTHEEFRKNLKKLEKQGIKSLIVDLRENPGGLIDQAENIADEFLDKEIIVSTKGKNTEKEVVKAKPGKTNVDLVLLVNKGSASSSEILSGAIKDNHRGILVGEKTFGKGIIQRIFPLNDNTGFKLTIAQYFTPSGISIHKKGIQPDIKVVLDENSKEDTQLNEAIKVLKSKK